MKDTTDNNNGNGDASKIAVATNCDSAIGFRQPDETRYPGYGADFRARPKEDESRNEAGTTAAS